MSTSLVNGINTYLAQNDEPFAILWDDRTPYLCTSGGQSCLEQTDSVTTYNVSPAVSTQNMRFNDITAVADVGNAPENMEIIVASEQGMARTTVSVTVPLKKQWGPTQCWAACVASVGQQQTGKDYDSQTVARIMSLENIGATTEETNAALVAIYHINSFANDSSPYTSTVIEKLNAKKPLIFLSLAKNQSGQNVGHAVVAYSFSGNPNSGILGYMNPTDGGFSSITTSSNGVYQFTWWGRLYETVDAILIR